MSLTSLKEELIARGIRPNAVAFSNSGPLPEERYCILKAEAIWEVYYYERGNKNAFQMFLDEGDACTYLLSLLERDRSVWQRVG